MQFLLYRRPLMWWNY